MILYLFKCIYNKTDMIDYLRKIHKNGKEENLQDLIGDKYQKT